MSGLNRYKLDIDCLYIDSEGDYVWYSDYAELQAKLDELRKEELPMNNANKAFSLFSIMSFVFTYLSVSFVQMSFDPTVWSEGARVLLVAMYTLLNVISAVMCYADK